MAFSVMFHHFHNNVHPKSQGSISGDQFENIIDWLETRFNLLDASDFAIRLENNILKENDICLSFDDSLLCQFQIAYPILRKRNIKVFFFVYTSIFTKKPDLLEIYRLFRNTQFKSIDYFYEEFFKKVEEISFSKNLKHWNNFKRINYLKNFSFYSQNDKWFRYLRENYLGEYYHALMQEMMREHNYNIEKESQNLWMTKKHLKELNYHGHIIGLHSHSHPTKITSLSYLKQLEQYKENLFHLKEILGHSNITSMSHPCGEYNSDSLKILKRLGVKIGFRSNMSTQEIKSSLEIPREDHSNILKLIKS